MRRLRSTARSRIAAVPAAMCMASGLLFGLVEQTAAGVEGKIVDPMEVASKLLQLSVARNGEANTIISPLSLSVALHMAAGGANGATETAFRAALGIGGSSTESFVQGYGDYVRAVASHDPKVIFRSVNGLWLAGTAEPIPAYLELLRNGFQARVETEDFSKPKAIKDINDWFARQTQRLIPKMVSEIPPDARAILANALYFKRQWTTPFPASATRPSAFHLAGGRAADVPMMRRSDDGFLYAETASYQAVKLTFGKGEFEVLLALPKDGVDPANGAGELMSAANARFSERPGRISRPRLKLTSVGDMKPVLEAFGLKEAF